MKKLFFVAIVGPVAGIILSSCIACTVRQQQQPVTTTTTIIVHKSVQAPPPEYVERHDYNC